MSALSLVVVIGWSATATGALLGLPQLLRLVRTRQVEGLSLFAWWAMMTVNLSWLAHGIHIAQPPQIATNVIALCSTVPILVLLTRSLGRSVLTVVASSLAVVVTIVTIDIVLGSLAFGIAAVIPGVVSYLSQGTELVRSERVDGVSGLFLTLAVLNQCLWLAWAWLLPDAGTIIACTLTLTMTGLTLLWYVLRRLGLRPLFARAEPDAVASVREPALTRG